MKAVRPLRVIQLASVENVHHRRFADALRDRGHDVRSMPVGADLRTADVVLAGPLPHVAEEALRATDAPVVAVSWGSDLLRDARADAAVAERTAVVLARASTVIVDSHAGEQVALALGAASDHLFRFPWGIELDRHSPRPMPLPGSPLRVVSLRTLVPEYRVDTLVRALASTFEVTADIAGGGPEENLLRGLARDFELEDRVQFHGRVAEDDVAELLAGAHVHVSTSPTDGSSISLLQALACGRPSVVVDNAANREWVEEGRTGWLVPAGDHEALADRLQTLVGDPSVLHPVAEAGRAVAVARADWRTNRAALWRAVETAARSEGSETAWS